MTLSATLSDRAPSKVWHTNRIYLYGTDTVLAPRDALIPRALRRLCIGAELVATVAPGERAEFDLHFLKIQRIRYLTVHPSIYLWRFERATLVMVVQPTGAYRVEAFEGASSEADARAYAFDRSLALGFAVTFRPPNTVSDMLLA